ncbi:MAG: cyclase family protein [Candidatus Asgardarchaeia archaeon]
MLLEELLKIIKDFKVVDLSLPYVERMPVWRTEPPYHRIPTEGPELGKPYFRSALLFLHEHHGTHVDAPLHYHKGKKSIEEFPLDRFFGPCLVLKIGKKEGENITVNDVKKWEKEFGEINEGDIVLINTGWYKRWKLLPEGKGYLVNMPGITEEAAKYLAEKRIKMIGVDGSIETYKPVSGSGYYPGHETFLTRDIIIIEGLTNLDKVPPRGSFFLGLPLKIRGGTGSPIRAVALVPKK